MATSIICSLTQMSLDFYPIIPKNYEIVIEGLFTIPSPIRGSKISCFHVNNDINGWYISVCSDNVIHVYSSDSRRIARIVAVDNCVSIMSHGSYVAYTIESGEAYLCSLTDINHNMIPMKRLPDGIVFPMLGGNVVIDGVMAKVNFFSRIFALVGTSNEERLDVDVDIKVSNYPWSTYQYHDEVSMKEPNISGIMVAHGIIDEETDDGNLRFISYSVDYDGNLYTTNVSNAKEHLVNIDERAIGHIVVIGEYDVPNFYPIGEHGTILLGPLKGQIVNIEDVNWSLVNIVQQYRRIKSARK